MYDPDPVAGAVAMTVVTNHAYDTDCLVYDGGTAYDNGSFTCPSFELVEVTGPVNPSRDAYTFRFYDGAGQMDGMLSSNTGCSPLIKASFDVVKAGPGRFTMELAWLPSFPIGHGRRLDIHLWNQQAPVWSGEINQVPGADQSAHRYSFAGMGWIDYLSRLEWTKTYAVKKVWEIVEDIADGYNEATPIIRQSTLIEQNSLSNYEVQSLEFFKAETEQVWKQLSNLAGGMTVGIDAQRRLFFKRFTKDIQSTHVLVVGKDINRWEPQTDTSKLFNRVIVKSGSVDTNALSPAYGTNYLEIELEDLASQALYGVRSKVVNAPNVLNPVDAYRFGGVELDRGKVPQENNPAQKVRYRGINWTPGEWIRILSGDKVHEHELIRNRYKLERGQVECTLSLGNDEDNLPKLQQELVATKAREELARQVSQKQYGL